LYIHFPLHLLFLLHHVICCKLFHISPMCVLSNTEESDTLSDMKTVCHLPTLNTEVSIFVGA
jgi:hypothetical protein